MLLGGQTYIGFTPEEYRELLKIITCQTKHREICKSLGFTEQGEATYMAHENKVNRLVSVFAAATLGAAALYLSYQEATNATSPEYYGGRHAEYTYRANNGRDQIDLLLGVDFIRGASDKICTQEAYTYIGPINEFDTKSEAFVHFAKELNWKDLQKIHAQIPLQIEARKAMLSKYDMPSKSNLPIKLFTQRKCGEENVLEKYGKEYYYPEGKSKPGDLRRITM